MPILGPTPGDEYLDQNNLYNPRSAGNFVGNTTPVGAGGNVPRAGVGNFMADINASVTGSPFGFTNTTPVGNTPGVGNGNPGNTNPTSTFPTLSQVTANPGQFAGTSFDQSRNVIPWIVQQQQNAQSSPVDMNAVRRDTEAQRLQQLQQQYSGNNLANTFFTLLAQNPGMGASGAAAYFNNPFFGGLGQTQGFREQIGALSNLYNQFQQANPGVQLTPFGSGIPAGAGPQQNTAWFNPNTGTFERAWGGGNAGATPASGTLPMQALDEPIVNTGLNQNNQVAQNSENQNGLLASLLLPILLPQLFDIRRQDGAQIPIEQLQPQNPQTALTSNRNPLNFIRRALALQGQNRTFSGG